MLLRGTAVSGGLATGALFVHRPVSILPVESHCRAEEAPQLLQQFTAVRSKAVQDLKELCAALRQQDTAKAEIFEAHRQIANDVTIHEEIVDSIVREHCTPEWAIHKIFNKYAQLFGKANDALTRERAADLEDVKDRMLRILHNQPQRSLAYLPQPAILAAKELLPSDVATLDREKVLAILTEAGGATSHTAILARSYGIPAIVGIEGLLAKVRHGQPAAVDALRGDVTLNPSQAFVKKTEEKRRTYWEDVAQAEKMLGLPAVTVDGTAIHLGLNIASIAEIKQVTKAEYAEYVGLFRTESLFLERSTLPEEDEQFAVYKNLLQTFAGRPVVLRTMDIGGDKPLQSLQLPPEENPFLGCRGIRFCFAQPAIFKTQLRAALRAAVFGDLWLMLPMVGSLEEIAQAKKKLEEVKRELGAEGIAYGAYTFGVMVEVPAVALLADELAKVVDFASIGTNDLCQYMMAADRTNATVAKYYQAFHPAVFRLLKYVVEQFIIAGKPISICGEMAADPSITPVLLGLGLRRLSMAATSLPLVKRKLRGLTMEQAYQIAHKVLSFSTSEKIENYLAEI